MTQQLVVPGLPEWERAFRSDPGKALLERVLHTLRAHRMLRKGDRVILAISGGGDSIFLLGVLLQVRAILGLDLNIAHIHHGLRDDADDDAAFVEACARSVDLPFDLQKIEVAEHLGPGSNVEETARTLRYQALEAIRRARGARRIAVGHTLTDSVETFLFHLARGAGFGGLAGIPPVRPPIVRPLIGLKRQEIRKFLQAFEIPYREDPTNTDLRRSRNYIRLKILPLLEQRFPGIQNHIAQLMTLHREFQDLLMAQIPKKQDLVKFDSGQIEVLDLPALKALHPAILRGFLHKTYHLDFQETERVMIKIREGGKVQTRTRFFWASFKDLAVLPIPLPHLRLPPLPWKTEDLGLPQINVRLVQRVEKQCTIQTPWEICFPLQSVDRKTLQVRSWRPGEWLPVFGAKRKLKDLFQWHQVPAWRRGLWPVVADRQGILWVVGLASTHRTQRHGPPWLKMEVKKHDPKRPWILDF